MRPETNPLDLNNLPDDYSTRDTKQAFDARPSSGLRKKKSGGKEGKDERGKVYECRFCSLKFCKSQALGGHMNRHRQERETETLNRARQLVFNSDNLAAHSPYLECHPIGAGSYHPTSNVIDSYTSVYQPRIFTGFASTILRPALPLQPHQSYVYIDDYYISHVLNSSNSGSASQAFPVNYGISGSSHQDLKHTCIGAAVGLSRGGGSERDGSLSNQDQEEGLYWPKNYAATGIVAVGGSQQQLLDPTSSINGFQGGI